MNDRVTVALDHRHPPFSQLDIAGDLRGFSVDVIRAAFTEVGIKVDVRPVDGPMAQVMWLAAGRVDAAADITVTERRRAWFAFSAHYHVEELMVFGLRGGPIWPGFRHFAGKLAVKVNSYVQEFLVRHHPRIPLVAVDTTEALLDALQSGRAQAFAATRETGLALITEGDTPGLIAEGAPFGPAPIALATLPADADRIIAPFNAGLDAISHSGQLDHLRRTWLHAFAHSGTV
ncbi:MAG: transporter substrate-binding domain-containing protein [Chloroflexi bacterium]|nr:transporter substrate-binding domain-containing protein [Chloroflexota bacterium]